MVFCRTKRTCDKVAADMADRGFAAAAVHGDLGQGAREQALRAFRSGKIDVLVATDVAARGIDVQDVTHVINYQCPDDESTFLHRIGRTGRAGAKRRRRDLRRLGRHPEVGPDQQGPRPGLRRAGRRPTAPRPHLYADLGIPVGTKGTLPRAARVRAGPGGRGGRGPRRDRPPQQGRRPGPGRGRDSGRDGGRDSGRDAARDSGRGQRPEAADDAPRLPKRTGAPRRRTRGAGLATGAATGSEAGSGPAEAGADGEAPPRAGAGAAAGAAAVARAPTPGHRSSRPSPSSSRRVRLLLLADTHVPRRARDLPAQVWDEVDRADVVVHAGDWVELDLLDALQERSAQLLACWGNNDGPDLRARLPEVARATLDGLRVAVVHETGAAAGRDDPRRRGVPGHRPAGVRAQPHPVGHDVTPGGLRLLNPGSPTDRRRQPVCTYLTARVDAGRLCDVRLHPTGRDT